MSDRDSLREHRASLCLHTGAQQSPGRAGEVPAPAGESPEGQQEQDAGVRTVFQRIERWAFKTLVEYYL